MAFRLPRLPRDFSLVDKFGKASASFQRWWQSVVEAIEGAFNAAWNAQIEAGVAVGEARQAQERIADALSQLAAMPRGDEELARIASALEGLLVAPPVAPVTLPDVYMPPMVPEYRESPLVAPVALSTTELADVQVQVPENRQGLVFDFDGRTWRNDFFDLDDLGDVTIATPTDRQALVFIGADNLWKNDFLDLDDLGDVVISSPAARQYLIYDGTNWVNDEPDLADFGITGAVDGDILIYDSGTGTGQFVVGQLTGDGNVIVTQGAGTLTVELNPVLSITSLEATLTNNSTLLMSTSATLIDGSGTDTGTLGNAPAAGDPTKWISISDNGTQRLIPTWS